MKEEALAMNIPALCKLRLGTDVPLSKTVRLGVLFDPQFADDPVFAEEDPIFAEENPISAEDPFVDAEKDVAELQALLMRGSLPIEKINIAELVTLLNRMNRDLQNSLKDVASDYLDQLQKNEIFLTLLPVLVRQMLTVPNAEYNRDDEEYVLRDNLIDVQTAVVKLICNSANNAILKQLLGSSEYFRAFLEAAGHRCVRGPGTRRVQQAVVNKLRDKEIIPQLQTMEEQDRKYGDTRKELFPKFSARESAGSSSDAPKESGE